MSKQLGLSTHRPTKSSFTRLAKRPNSEDQLCARCLPGEIGLLTNLEHLDLFSNDLTGAIRRGCRRDQKVVVIDNFIVAVAAVAVDLILVFFSLP